MNELFESAARERIAVEASAVESVATVFDAATEQILDVLYQCAGMVFVTGSGTSGTIARRMAHLFSVSGTPSVFMQPSDALHGTMGALRDKDVLIAISKGGRSDEINDLCRRAKQRGVTVIALTSDNDAELANISDHIQLFPIADQVDPGNVIAMGSTLMHAVWGDCLAVALMRMRGYSWADVVFTHPLGAVGKIEDLPGELPSLPVPGAE
ncbi:SIS domain-containing protein [Propionicimonas sp.]|uniref:KpsF/GutQ family sugar-phosphate isomerase n=1 Tax=Propionicimonas sp. TaxID=1955623 RepID=UPI0018449091|nr:SIS domain-containing protein [Propionicimonas sp.]MBU3976841.1 SIS domain-containing protein [Actinomycetota bacterium]MBA3019530.1 SIS domain-containing protein [Propionicimonas sp.]MBU3986936.1 SIS domain-containing protein [Actinomycetota bacterium]MBU4006848.1 SIS domain-containing protein [Actinomycetota bacterium]MBU4065548.1 SIS domain-containing protein [Actinomycetota bacterium]